MDTELEDAEDEYDSEQLFDDRDNDITYDPKRDGECADSDDSQG